MGEALLPNRAASCYKKVRDELLQSGAGNLLQCGAGIRRWTIFVIKWGFVLQKGATITKRDSRYPNFILKKQMSY